MGRRSDTEYPSAPSLMDNWMSLTGAILAASSFFAVGCLFALDFFGGFRSPYLGILTYLVAPFFLVAGISLVVIGMLRERRRRLRRGVLPPFPRLDLNVPRQRHLAIAAVIACVVFLLSTAVGSYGTYQFTESVTFCGASCHSIMRPEYTTYRQSPHARVACVQCHIGPGASWFVKSKLSGVYQVYATLANKYPRPIPAPIRSLRPARETCEQCHWPEHFFGAVERTFRHYLPDERNSPWTIRMLMNVGGADPRFGAVEGIHWHMAIANEIAFIASDKQRQIIPWVRLTDEQGTVTVYQSSDSQLTPEQVAAAQPHVMDCIDCHNRPSHIFNAPGPSVDLALQTGRIDRSIPRIKERAVQALTKEYATTEEAERGIADSLTAFYRSRYPAFADSSATLLAQAIASTQRIYAENFFPDMKVDWRAYPDNIGHKNAPGCDRCHDGDHASADGRRITGECDACHALIQQGAPGNMETDLGGLEFKHPVDISGEWRDTACSECHSGALAE